MEDFSTSVWYMYLNCPLYWEVLYIVKADLRALNVPKCSNTKGHLPTMIKGAWFGTCYSQKQTFSYRDWQSGWQTKLWVHQIASGATAMEHEQWSAWGRWWTNTCWMEVSLTIFQTYKAYKVCLCCPAFTSKLTSHSVPKNGIYNKCGIVQ